MAATLARAAKRLTARISAGLFSAFGGDGAGILMFHRVGGSPDSDGPTWCVGPQTFEHQLLGLRERGYSFRPLQDLIDTMLKGEPALGKAAAITFDDGYACVFTDAFPVLARHRIPATIFLATAYVGSSEPFPFDGWGKRHAMRAPANLWRPLSWDQCRIMAASGLISFGSHTDRHDNYARDLPGLRRDLQRSRERLLSELGEGPRTFAYPGGARSLGLAGAAMASEIAAAGFSAAFTTEYGRIAPGQDLYLLPRYEVTGDDDATTIAAKLAGWHDWVGAVREVYRLRRRLVGAEFGH